MAEQVTVSQLIAGMDRRGTGDVLAAYRELSQLSCDLSLLVDQCRQGADFFGDRAEVWRYARGSGLYRRSQALVYALTQMRNPVELEEPLLCWQHIGTYEVWLREACGRVARGLKQVLLEGARTGDYPVERIKPVVDGQINGDLYGYADSAEGALEVTRGRFADPISHVEFSAPEFVLADGTPVLGGAWVPITVPCEAAAE